MSDTPPTHTIAETQRMQFESAWVDGRPPSIEETLESVPAGQRSATLEELVAIDIEFRAKSSNAHVQVEQYVQRFPELNDNGMLARLAAHEFWVRHAYGDQPTYASYCERFPQLFSTEQQAREALGKPPAVRTKTAWEPGQSLGRYKLLEKHAEGGFGEVWKAKDTRLDRVVALKRLSDRVAHVADGQRLFTLEVAVTAQLQHPGIVPVHDFNSEGDSSYYAMQFLSGHTLAEAISAWRHEQSQSPVELRRLLNRYIALCQTVAFAHAHGIVHRDLKPQNVMLGDFGETIVLDWGLAKDVNASLGEDSNESTEQADAQDAPSQAEHVKPGAMTIAAFQTEQGAVLGTPGYMPPEQAEGRIDDVSQQADVYALGAILFELIHGEPPTATALAANERLPRPLNALAAVADRAMADKPEDRYAGAAELVAEVERWLADEPVDAYPDPLWIRAKRWLKRHRTAAAGLAVALGAGVVCAIVVSAVSIHSNRILRASQAQTDEQRRVALANLDVANENLYYHRVLLAHNEYENNNVTRAIELLDLCPTELRNWEWWFVRRLCQTGNPQVLRHETDSVLRCVEFSPSSELAASLTRDGVVHLWDGRRLVRTWETGGIGRELRFLDDHRIVVGGTAEKRGMVSIWSLTGELERQFEAHRYAIAAIAVSDDGQWLATGSSDKKLRVWKTEDWSLASTGEGHEAAISAIDFSADSTQIATGSTDETVKLWSRESGELIANVLDFGAEVHAVAFDPTRPQLAIGGHASEIQLASLDAPSRAPKQLTGHSHFVRQLEFSSDGKLLVSASFDRTVRLWRMPDGEVAEVLRGHDSHLRWAAVSQDASQIASAAEDRTVRLWSVDEAWADPPEPGSMIAMANVDGSDERLALCTDKQFQLRGLGEAEPRWTHPATARIYEVAMNSDGTSALGMASGEIVVLDSQGQSLCTLDAGSPVLALTFGAVMESGDSMSACLYSGGLDGAIRCWNVNSGESVWTKRAHPGGVACLEFVAGRSHLLSAGLDGFAGIWDGRGERLQSLPHPDKVSRIVAHPHRREIATACLDGRVRIWDAEGTMREEIVVGNQWVNCIAYSPDGLRLASGSEESVKLWAINPAGSSEEVLSLTGHQCIQELMFSEDGEQLILSGIHRGLRIYDGSVQE